MTATVHKLRPSTAGLRCSECGATAKAACNCGADYIPAGRMAARAIAAHPEKSDRAIAADLGVSDRTVNRARKSTATNDAVRQRIGKDGKARKLPQRQRPNIRTQVNEMARSPTEFTHKYIERLGAWLETKPKLSSEAITMLSHALHLCSEEFERIARHVKTYKGGTDG